MTTYLVFARTAYADPLALVTTVTAEAPPRPEDLDAGDALELVLVPEDDVIWVVRDGALASAWSGVTT